MYLVEFNVNFEVLTRNNELLIFIPSYSFPMDCISIPTLEYKNKKINSWCNLIYTLTQIRFDKIKRTYIKAIDFDFKSNVFVYCKRSLQDNVVKKETYRILFQLPDALLSLKEKEHLFYCMEVKDGEVKTKIAKHRVGTIKMQMVSINDIEFFKDLPMDERKSLLNLFLSKQVDNFNLALNILNIYR